MSQTLRGFIGQSVSGERRTLTPEVHLCPPGSYSLRVTATGLYRFVLWGGGGNGNNPGNNGGGGGGYVEAVRAIGAGQIISLTVGEAGVDTLAAFSGNALRAGAGSTLGPGGIAVISGSQSETDILLTGGAGGTAGAAGLAGAGNAGGYGGPGGSRSGGGGSPGNGYHRGAPGSPADQSAGNSPGGGGATTSGSSGFGGEGLALVYQVQMRP